MRHKGGTPFSIVRDLFLYWDANKSGTMSSEELNRCLKSIGYNIL